MVRESSTKLLRENFTDLTTNEEDKKKKKEGGRGKLVTRDIKRRNIV
jgi:hypothetical protein